MKNNLITWSSVILLAVSFAVEAQKLPNKQEISVRAPANIKIDGDADEWNNQFQAYNHAVELFYTISNNDDNLYLCVQATNPLVMRKIIAGGITFSLRLLNAGKDDKGITFSFPFFDKRNLPNINLRNKPIKTNNQTTYKIRLDSFKNVINKQFMDKSKEIGVSGIGAINDTSLSIYNQENIKAQAKFNDEIIYTYELAVPLKYVGLSVNRQPTFDYNIRLTGSTHVEGAVIENIPGGTRIRSSSKDLPTMEDMTYLSVPTDFSGTYTLAKK